MRYQLLRLSARATQCLAASLAAVARQLEQHGLAHPIEIDPEVAAEWRRFKEARARFWQTCSAKLRPEDHDAQ